MPSWKEELANSSGSRISWVHPFSGLYLLSDSRAVFSV